MLQALIGPVSGLIGSWMDKKTEEQRGKSAVAKAKAKAKAKAAEAGDAAPLAAAKDEGARTPEQKRGDPKKSLGKQTTGKRNKGEVACTPEQKRADPKKSLVKQTTGKRNQRQAFLPISMEKKPKLSASPKVEADPTRFREPFAARTQIMCRTGLRGAGQSK